MSIRSFDRRNLLFVLAGIFVIILIYSLNPYKLSYRLKDWKQFGETPITVNQILYFIEDTPDVIGYKEPGSGKMVSCGATVAYVKTTGNETYRCCDTSTQISCLAGDFSREIPVFDEQCTGYFREAFGLPASLPDTKDYEIFGSCAGGSSSLTVAQINNRGQILWKTFNINNLNLLRTVLRCIVGPLLLILVIWIIIGAAREKKNEPIPRF